MRLISAGASPFVRKVRVLLIETGLDGKVELDAAATTPVKPDAKIVASNPLAKIPCLVTDDGQALYDSRVICEYLDGLHAGAKMFPSGAARWPALRRQALGDGIMDAGVLTRYETFLRPENLRWADWIAGQGGKIARGVDALAAEAGALNKGIDIGAIACACALGYLDFRFPDMAWRDGRGALADWYEGFAARPSMQQTAPA